MGSWAETYTETIYPSIFKAEHKTLSSTGQSLGAGSGEAAPGSKVQGLAK